MESGIWEEHAEEGFLFFFYQLEAPREEKMLSRDVCQDCVRGDRKMEKLLPTYKDWKGKISGDKKEVFMTVVGQIFWRKKF